MPLRLNGLMALAILATLPDVGRPAPRSHAPPPGPRPAPSAEAFHAHLDRCEWCDAHPFDLCAEGAALVPADGQIVAGVPVKVAEWEPPGGVQTYRVADALPPLPVPVLRPDALPCRRRRTSLTEADAADRKRRNKAARKARRGNR